MSDELLLEFYKKNSGWFEIGSFLLDAIRYLSFGIVKILYAIAKSCHGLYDKTFELLDFTKWAGIDEFINENKLAITSILAISIFFIGVILILNHEKKKNIVHTILIAFISISSVAYLMTEINGLVIEGKNAIVGTSSSQMSSANQITRGYIYDLLYIDSKVGITNFNQGDGDALASYHFSEAAIDDLMKSPISRINQKIKKNQDGLSKESKDIFSKTIEPTATYDAGGIMGQKVRKLEEGTAIGGFGKEEYYQYHVETMPLMIGLISLILIFVFVSYKAFKIIYELVFSKILLIFNAANLTGGEITLKILDSIKNSYIILLLTAVLIKIYTIGASTITRTFASNVWVSSLFLVFLSLATIDAPNIVAKITGVDVGVNNEKMAMMGLLMMGGRGLSIVNKSTSGLFSSFENKNTTSSEDKNISSEDSPKSLLDNLREQFQNQPEINREKESASRNTSSIQQEGMNLNNIDDTIQDQSNVGSDEIHLNESMEQELSNHPQEEMKTAQDISDEILKEYLEGGFDHLGIESNGINQLSESSNHPGNDSRKDGKHHPFEKMEQDIALKTKQINSSSKSNSLDENQPMKYQRNIPEYKEDLKLGKPNKNRRGFLNSNQKSLKEGQDKSWAMKEFEKERKDKS